MKHIKRLLTISCVIYSVFFLYGCKCDEAVYMAVMPGPVGAKGCNRLQELYRGNPDSMPTISFACPGEEVTICWGGNVDSLLIEPINLKVGSVGSHILKVDQTTVFKIKPLKNSCASAREFKVQIINGPTTAPFDGAWSPDLTKNETCGAIFFNISDLFMSPGIKVTDITANFDAKDATSSSCDSNPFMSGKNKSILSSPVMQLLKPFQKRAFSTPVPAVGDWLFVFTDKNCNAGCKKNAVLPFEFTLTCPDN